MARAASPLLAYGSLAVALAVSYAIKAQCVFRPWIDELQYRRLCYNDIQPLFGVRGISRALVPYRDVRLEYPVLTGVFMDFAGRLMRFLSRLGVGQESDPDYFNVTVFLLVPLAFAVTFLLRKRVPASRLLLWTVGTPVVLYSFHNWDLIAVAAAVWGVVLAEQSLLTMAGGALAVGASAKLYPSFLAPGQLLALWSEGKKKAAVLFVAGFIAMYALINVPVIAFSNGLPGYLDDPQWPTYANTVSLRPADKNGWLETWTFHAERYPDFGTVWYWIAHHGRVLYPTAGGEACDLPQRACWWDPGHTGYRDFVSLVSFLLFGAGTVFFLWNGWKRRAEPQGFPVIATGLGIILAFLITSKVHSPQYALWIAPLLVMLDIDIRRVVLYFVSDLALYISGFYFFTVMSSPAPAWKGIFEVTVWARALALVLLAWSAMKAFRKLPDPGVTEAVQAAS